MDIDLTLKNYRCFPDSEPAHLTISDGWTAFVGVNNAGKSTILRVIYDFRNMFRNINSVDIIARNIDYSMYSSQQIFPPSVRDPHELCNSGNDRQLLLEVAVGEPPNRLEITFALDRNTKSVLIHSLNGHILRSVGGLTTKIAGTPESVSVADGSPRDVRSLFQALAQLAGTFYIGAFRNILNTGSKDDYFDIQVGDAFVKKWRTMQSGDNKSDAIKCVNVVKAIEKLLKYERLEIQPSADDSTLQVTINGRPHKLHEVGSGIAHLILVLASVAIRNPSYILIDEPELNLHPTLQLDFLSELGKFATQGMLFTTHNIGLARASADRIYSVIRVAEGHSRVVRYESTPNLPEFLGTLSYSSYQALGFDKVLLVEGPTEVRTIQQFLRKLKKDHRILLLPLGGGQLISADREAQLSEIRRITPHVSVLIDSERKAAGDELELSRRTFIESCINLKFSCCVLERRAIENYLAEAAIRKVKGVKYSALPHFATLKDAANGWAKSENWRIAAEMDWSDIQDTDLGKFLMEL
jgi:ABC-type cobalamin/Fe3+-siderophores transport system ATPase subunit